MSFSEAELKIWPKPQIFLSDFLSGMPKLYENIEGFFNDLYPNAHSVLTPSGRSALTMIIRHLGMTRRDHVLIPPYSSHCVINSIGYVSTPTPMESPNIKSSLVFHQWGYPQMSKTDHLVIEDSVDSLIPKGGSLFPNDGLFEILSLPKIFGCLIGGIILCQNADDAEALKKIRDNTQSDLGISHFFLRVLGQSRPKLYDYWNTVEPQNGRIPSSALKNIWRRLMMMDALISDRIKKIKLLESSKLKPVSPMPDGRYPACWPIATNQPSVEKSLPKDIIRHFPTPKGLQQVYPLPLHNQISVNAINIWLSQHDYL